MTVIRAFRKGAQGTHPPGKMGQEGTIYEEAGSCQMGKLRALALALPVPRMMGNKKHTTARHKLPGLDTRWLHAGQPRPLGHWSALT